MKRSQDSVSSPPKSSNHKKAKVAPNQVVHHANTAREDHSTGDGEWTRVEKRKAKKNKKVEAKHDALMPRFMYVNGEIVKRKDAVHINDVRDLILHIVADAPPPNWVKVEHPRSIEKVVALLIPGILPSTFHACPTRAPGDQTRMYSVLSEFFQCQVTPQEKAKRQAQRASITPALYMLTLKEMIENEYPVPSYMADVFEKEVSEESLLLLPADKLESKIYAIDCEMCLTEDGKELTRVCMIDYESGIVVYDKLVKPPKPVTDYMTKWSGITESLLASATTTVAEVQAQIMPILAPKEWTDIHSSRGADSGHDPEEDARACIDLLRAKLRYGPSYGDVWGGQAGRGGPGSVRSVVVDHGNPGVMHGSKASSNVPCTSDEEVLNGLLQAIPAHEFAFGRFTGVADALGWLTTKATAAETPVVTPAEPSPIVLANAQATLNNQLVTLYTSLPARTALIIFTGHSDPRRMASLNARKSAFESCY
ncbi:hypothetical protein F4604DRAFT_1876618 [Suillus subluteus]|nr:hypothetical protein F4604DRAFT_1876618 [Suillus subluteus]